LRSLVSFFLLLLLSLPGWAESLAEVSSDKGQWQYVGAEACRICHGDIYQQWQQSDHHKAMQLATSATVAGDFANVTVQFHGIASRFYRQQGLFMVETAGEGGKRQAFQIKYTFGFYPLQQYLVEMNNGFIQALNIAWDSRPQEQGGQRWFHLQPDEVINPDHPFFWTRFFQNWNNRCADCHSTNLEKKYDAEKHAYQTSWSEMNVACEACHGPASQHVELARQGKAVGGKTGFSDALIKPMHWQFKAGQAVASPVDSLPNPAQQQQLKQCGACHSLRTPLHASQSPSPQSGHSVESSHRLQLLSEPAYFADGQIRGEVFVLGSFLQSKMHQQGVTCSNCHNPHSGKVWEQGNGLCGQCHDAKVFDQAEHHHHQPESTGSLCVNCHMPERTYMQVDDRRDHSFSIPRPDLSAELGVPNACVNCHTEPGKDNSWAQNSLTSWGVKPARPHWGSWRRGVQSGNASSISRATAAITSGELAAIVSATLLEELAVTPSQESLAAAQVALQDDNPLVRRGAVAALRNMPGEVRWQLLSPHVQDPSLAVRHQLAEVLADLQPRLPETAQQVLSPLLAEYRASLAVMADSPATQLLLADLEIKLGNPIAAEKALQKALRIESHFVPALLNSADFYRSKGEPEKVGSLLQQALKLAPESAAVSHSYGLHLVRQKQYREALSYLAQAVDQADAIPRFAYVYAVALHSQGQTEQAIRVLVKAVQRWPGQYNLLLTLVTYLDRSGQSLLLADYLEELQMLAPDAPVVQNLMRKYGRSTKQVTP